MIGWSKKNRENDPKRAFEQRSKEAQITIKPWVSANLPSINCAQEYKRGTCKLPRTLDWPSWYLLCKYLQAYIKSDLLFLHFFIGKKAEQEVKLVQLKKLIEFFIVSEVISIWHNYSVLQC